MSLHADIAAALPGPLQALDTALAETWPASVEIALQMTGTAADLAISEDDHASQLREIRDFEHESKKSRAQHLLGRRWRLLARVVAGRSMQAPMTAPTARQSPNPASR